MTRARDSFGGRLLWLACGLLLLAGCHGDEATPGASSGQQDAVLPALPPGLGTTAREVIAAKRDALARALREPHATPRRQARAYGELGMRYHAYELMNEARLCYRRASELDPEEFRWAYFLGEAEHLLGEHQASARAYRQVLRLHPGHAPALLALARNEEASDDLAAAQEHYQEALAHGASPGTALTGLGRIALQRGEPEAALGHLVRALRHQPGSHQTHYSLAMAYRRLGDEARAARHLARMAESPFERTTADAADPLLEQIAKLRSSATVHERRAAKAAGLGNLARAVVELKQALATDPDRSTARHNLAVALLRQGRRQDALDQLAEVLERDPRHVPTHLTFGQMALNSARLKDAARHLQRALALDPNSAQVHLALANTELHSQRPQQALEFFQRALALKPGLERARFGAAASRLRLARYRRALQGLELDMEAMPQSRALRLLLARLRAAAPPPELRDPVQAQRLMRAQGLDEATVSEAETLAMAYAEQGDFDSARRWQQHALRATGAPPGRHPWVRRRLELYRRDEPVREPWAAGEVLLAARIGAPD